MELTKQELQERVTHLENTTLEEISRNAKALVYGHWIKMLKDFGGHKLDCKFWDYRQRMGKGFYKRRPSAQFEEANCDCGWRDCMRRVNRELKRIRAV